MLFHAAENVSPEANAGFSSQRIGELTVTVATLVTEPPGPMQVIGNVVFSVSVYETSPVVAPLVPGIGVHDVALVVLHDTVVRPPDCISLGFAVNVSVGIDVLGTCVVGLPAHCPAAPEIPVHHPDAQSECLKHVEVLLKGYPQTFPAKQLPVIH